MTREYPDRPLAGVGVVVFNGESVLLVQRGKPPEAGAWSLPGGAQELGETIRETAVREVREETGIEITGLQLLDVFDLIAPGQEGRIRHHYTLIDFAADYAAGRLAAASDAADAQWWPVETAIDLVSWDETKKVIRMAADRRQETQ